MKDHGNEYCYFYAWKRPNYGGSKVHCSILLQEKHNFISKFTKNVDKTRLLTLYKMLKKPTI